MGHALINLTTLLDRKIHRGWHKLVGEATDVNETITVELGGEVELIVQWCHSPAKVAEVVPPTTPKPAKPSPSGISAGISGSTQKKYFLASRRRAWPRPRARARRARRPRARRARARRDRERRGAGHHDRGGRRRGLAGFGGGLHVREPLRRAPVLEPRGLRDAARRRAAFFFFSRLRARRRRDGACASRAQAEARALAVAARSCYRGRVQASPSCCTACPRRSSLRSRASTASS